MVWNTPQIAGIVETTRQAGTHIADEDLFKLRREVSQAQGIILGTPEYHGSFSGILKNALDLMGFDEIEGKMIGLVGVSGGALGAVNALSSLRTVGGVLHAWVVPEQVSIPKGWKVFDESGNLKDSAMEEQLKDAGRQVARFAFLHKSEKAQEFLRAWEGAPVDPGASSIRWSPCYRRSTSGEELARLYHIPIRSQTDLPIPGTEALATVS